MLTAEPPGEARERRRPAGLLVVSSAILLQLAEPKHVSRIVRGAAGGSVLLSNRQLALWNHSAIVLLSASALNLCSFGL